MTDIRPLPADDGGADHTVTRRAPFSDNPRVGVRGLHTQQRILDAAVRVFGEQGYHRCSVDRITAVAGCSRVSFYQYFSGKEDLYRTLSGQLARQLAAAIEALGVVTPDEHGWQELRAWVDRYADIYQRYEPIFVVFHEAAETDVAVAGGSARVSAANIARLCSRLAGTRLPTRQLETVVGLLLETVTRTLSIAGTFRRAAPGAHPPQRIEDALADVVHRTFFGLQEGVNTHPPATRGPEPLDPGPVLREVGRRQAAHDELTTGGRRTLDSLLAAGREVFLRRGYHRTRVDDVVGAAGVSHGAFYRYFSNKDEMAHLVAVDAMRKVSTNFSELPVIESVDGAGRSALRSWLRRYAESYSSEVALIRVWMDASLQDPGLVEDSAAVVDWGRRRTAEFLRPRGFGDVDSEAVVLLGLLVALGARAEPVGSIPAAVEVIERGLLAGSS